ncbi:hypothetical protein ACQEVB_29040 [Pseudonocardia sp. CA-107938]|uniref:hypothetical protein n=1 Tax=Pseudonocardia sp. CA-107938 TaxID=3240021 RepID=UPI003D948211
MAKQQELADIAAATNRISELVLDAVRATLAERSAEPARQALTPLSGGFTDEQRTIELMVTLILVRWLSVVRDHVESTDLVEPVLAWIRDELGPRYAARARYTSEPLVDEERAADIMGYRDALRDDFLPSLAWQLAAAVALHGDGSVEWLRDLVGRAG